jgi:hypothetical protein
VSTPVWSVALPPDADPPYDVYVNGERRTPGVDYTVEGRWVRFTTPLKPQPALGLGRRIMLGMGIGVYGDLTGDVVDVSFRRHGQSELASGLPIIPPLSPGGETRSD